MSEKKGTLRGCESSLFHPIVYRSSEGIACLPDDARCGKDVLYKPFVGFRYHVFAVWNAEQVLGIDFTLFLALPEFVKDLSCLWSEGEIPSALRDAPLILCRWFVGFG